MVKKSKTPLPQQNSEFRLRRLKSGPRSSRHTTAPVQGSNDRQKGMRHLQSSTDSTRKRLLVIEEAIQPNL